jgi:hypothetical protein
MIRMTGGGSIFLPNSTANNIIADFGSPKDDRRITHGFQLHCAQHGAKGGDITTVNNRLEINWGSPDSRFHLSYLTAIDCPNDPNIDPPPPPFTAGGPDTLVGKGVGLFSGTFKGQKYSRVQATISFILTDAGEPGTSDTASYIIMIDKNNNKVADDGLSAVVLDTGDNDGFARDMTDFATGTAGKPVIPPTSQTDPGTPDINFQRFLFKGNHQVHLEIPPLLKKLPTTVTQLEAAITNTLDALNVDNLSAAKISNLTDQLLSQYTAYYAALKANGINV